ncbi:MAG: ATP-dependent Clp protease adapter ClpS [Deltaproteobacteria bacterium]|nr:ATP-dependent Clp protease adapter ClpS [Deltaproteobacteria bacterium]
MAKQKQYFDEESGVQTLPEKKVRVKKPNLYRVLLLNDDYTPMEYVVWLLQTVFYKPLEEATRLMMDVHQKGKGLCGIYPQDVAQTKVAQVRSLSEQYGHPLEAVLESEERE